MQKLKESDIQKQIIDYLEYMGALVIRINNVPTPLRGGGFRKARKRGLPDIFGIIPRKERFGIPFFVEVKSAKGKLSPDQEQFLNDADHAGCIAIEARSVELVKKTLDPFFLN